MYIREAKWGIGVVLNLYGNPRYPVRPRMLIVTFISPLNFRLGETWVSVLSHGAEC